MAKMEQARKGRSVRREQARGKSQDPQQLPRSVAHQQNGSGVT